MFSLPVLVFAQCTGRSKGGTVTAPGGNKGSAHPEFARKGASKAPKKTGVGNAPAVETKIGKINETNSVPKGGAGPTTSARKKPPRPAPAKPPDPK